MARRHEFRPGDWESAAVRVDEIISAHSGEDSFEEALKLHPTVNDAVVVGVPDDKFGQAITAVVEPAAGASIDEATLIAEVKAHLAPYKAPKRVLVVDTIGRAPNGKVDYKRHLTYALDQLGIEPSPIPVANA